MFPEQISEQLSAKYEELLGDLRAKLSKINVGRASPAVLEDIIVDTGQYQAALQELASMRLVEPQTLLVEPWDKSLVDRIEKAIAQANLNVSTQPRPDGLYVKFPQASEETRQRAIREVNQLKEEVRVQARQVREEKWQEVKDWFANKEISEDQKFRIKELLDEQIGEINEQIEQISERKIENISKR